MVLESINETRLEAFTHFLDSEASVFVTTSNASDFTDLAAALNDSDFLGSVNVLTDEDTIKEVRRRFLTASHLVDCIEDDLLQIRSQNQQFPTFLLTETDLLTVTGIDDSIVEPFTRTDSEFVERTYEEVTQRFGSGRPVDWRTPAYSHMLKELGEELGETMQTDVTSMLDQALATRDDESDIDPVRLSILAGAKNEVEFYVLGRWGEYTGVASKSKYSREKTRLEDLGIIDTEKIQGGVGRPRQRLVLADDMSGTDVEDLMSLSESVLF